jgi:hypothetical protein
MATAMTLAGGCDLEVFFIHRVLYIWSKVAEILDIPWELFSSIIRHFRLEFDEPDSFSAKKVHRGSNQTTSISTLR